MNGLKLKRSLPIEIAEFESKLKKPINDPTGLAGFFNSGELVVTRVPARLDIMGGIADYSGANVCEGVLGRGMVVALQPRTDRLLYIRTMITNSKSLPAETHIHLDSFELGDEFVSYDHMRRLCHMSPISTWAAYIIGSIFTLLKEESIRLPFGFSLLLLSGVPMNVGVGSSASTEIATLHCLNNYLQLNLSESRLAQLGQMAENQVVGAPCGIMDQIAVTSGRQGKLTHILCRPGRIMGEVQIPEDMAFVGINSKVKHSVSGTQYGDVRIGAFIGKRIINRIREVRGKDSIEHLTELTVDSFEKEYRSELPETITGSDFLKEYESHGDPITQIQPGALYRVLGPTVHPIYENQRVLTFMAQMRDACNGGGEDALIAAGECMFGAHDSYRENCLLSVPEVDFLVNAVRNCGPNSGLYGAKITGGGSGGTVAIFGRKDALSREIPAIARDYECFTGLVPDVFEGTSPGAIEFGAFRYSFGPTGWSYSL